MTNTNEITIMNTSTWTVSVGQDPETGELFLPLPEEMLKHQGWVDGDTLDWIDNYDGTWTLQKVG